MDKFVDKVHRTIEKYGMFAGKKTVLVALSGGADSVALLCALRELRFSVRACHLNHQLRGEEAARDERFCRELCEKLEIPLTVCEKNVAEHARQMRQSIETAARILRYRFFEESANGDWIATAHTASDTAETMLFHLARGTGMSGLCGIPPVRGQIARPLIECTREEIEAFLQRIKQDFVTDSTNLTEEYTRNRIRHRVIPVLKEINPQAVHAAAALSEKLRIEEDYLEEQADKLFRLAQKEQGWDVAVLCAEHPAVVMRVLRCICARSGVPMGECTARHIEAMAMLLKNTRPSAWMDLPGGYIARREYQLLKITTKEENSVQSACVIPVTVPFDERCGKNGARVKIRKIEKNKVFYKTYNTFYVDCDTIDMTTCVLRTRQVGDRLRSTEHGGSKLLKKLLIEKKIPSIRRDQLAVLADKNGLIAVQEIGIDISRRPKGNTVFEICIEG